MTLLNNHPCLASNRGIPMRVYTIGFTQKRAETFFELLRKNGIGRLIDIRLNPGGQLAGFAKKEDLPYFLSRLADGCQYLHLPQLAPADEILKDYRTDKNWTKYVVRFQALMDERDYFRFLHRADFEKIPSCFLCSEPTADKCHRRLVVERIASLWEGVEIIHL